ncbi:hypothetical protein COMA2_120033 [Candidatus Nitrospira nitrificans]|uniref:Uncharacterized protein n=1 Tax=Candidatus Nitrospira nitrificans TaxID=1742973 RepID=A0A0S4L8T4_9BACT|nr:hypothetical protein COMA2_120033 [Candidatus Nitrospira nitrificans]
MRVTARLVSERGSSASAGWPEVREREPSAALRPAVLRPAFQRVESKQGLEAERPAQVSAAPVCGRQAVEVVGPAIRREAAPHSP